MRTFQLDLFGITHMTDAKSAGYVESTRMLAFWLSMYWNWKWILYRLLSWSEIISNTLLSQTEQPYSLSVVG